MKEASLKKSQTMILHIRYFGKHKTTVSNKDEISSCQGLGAGGGCDYKGLW